MYNEEMTKDLFQRKREPRSKERGNLFIKIALFIFIFLLSTKVITDTDLGWHILVGEHVAKTLSVPKTDLFSFSQPNYPYVYHSWATDVMIFTSYKCLGLWGVTIFYAVITTLSVFFLYRTSVLISGKVNYLFFLWVAPLAFTFAGGRTRAMGFLLMTILYFLFTKFQLKNSRAIWLAPLIFFLWANLHGSFILGIGVFAVLRITFRFFSKESEITSKFKSLLIIFFLSLVSTLANPYFFRAWKQAVVMTLNSTLALQSTNIDWGSLINPSGGGWFFAIIVAVVIFVLFFRKTKIARAQKFLLLLFFILSLLTARFAMALFAFFVPIANQLLWDITSRINKQVLNSITVKGFLAVLFVVLFLTAVGNLAETSLANRSFKEYSYYLEKFSANRILYPPWPYETNLFVKENLQDRRIFAEANWGSYMIWLNPAQKVFYWGAMDNFIINNRSFVFDYHDIKDAKPDWEEKINQYKIDAFFLPKEFPLVAVLNLRDDWEKIYDQNDVV